MANLPNTALRQLGCLFKKSIATLTVPAQQLLNILGLLDKKAEGSRTIASMASFYRALMKTLCPMVRDWANENAISIGTQLWQAFHPYASRCYEPFKSKTGK